MELTLTNRALQPMSGFAVQFNKNRFLVFCYIHVTWHTHTTVLRGILYICIGWFMVLQRVPNTSYVQQLKVTDMISALY